MKNMYSNIFRFFIFSILILFQAQSVHACRFNVRETGFVDLENERYFLVGYINDVTPTGIVKDFNDVTKQMLLGSNIEFELVNISKDKNHPAIQYLDETAQADYPEVILISLDGQSLDIKVDKREKRFRKSLQGELSNILSSNFRQKLQSRLIDDYGIVLLIESSNKEANAQALLAAQEAVTNVTKKMDLMPKVIKNPPRLMVVDYKDRANDAILLWTLGIDLARMDKPHAVIFYGRARWLGPLFRGEEITRNNLSEILFVVGADCECGLDKNWLRGTMLPMRWDKKAQTNISQNLGFDPENPMIKIEVNRIMRSEHYIPGKGIPSPGILAEPDSGDEPRQGLTYNDDGEKRISSAKTDSSDEQDGSLLTTSVIVTTGILALLLIVGSITIFRRSKNNS